MHSASVDNDISTYLSEPFLEGNRKSFYGRNGVLQKAVISIALVFILAGVGLSITAIILPSWQVVHLFEYNSVHEHGLWLDCTRGDPSVIRRHHSLTEPLNCVYKWDYDEELGTIGNDGESSPVGEVNRHKLYAWQAATLILLGLSLLSALIAICVGLCACGYRYLAIVFAAFTLLSTFLCTIAECVFFFYSHRADNRFINGIVGTYEQRVGLAFFLQLASCISNLIAFLISLLVAFLSLTRTVNSNDEMLNMAHTSRPFSTQFHRPTVELDRPVMYQGTASSDMIRSPPQYSGFGSYTKVPTASMPELTSKFQSGSETCV